MRDLINYAVFGWYPYLCLIVFLLGSWVVSTASNTPGAAARASLCAAGNWPGAQTCFTSESL